MNVKRIILPILIIGVMIFTFSCEAPEDNGIDNALKNGRSLVSLVSKIYYEAQSDINYTASKRQDLAIVLSKGQLDSLNKPLVLVNDYELKLNILSTYDDILANYFEMSDDEIKQKILSIANDFDSLKNEGENFEQDVKRMRKYAGSANFSKEKALYGLADVIYRMYSVDVANWKKKLDNAFEFFSAQLDSIPDDVFDEEKLQKFVYEPYKGKSNLINIYKMNLKQEAYEEKTKFIDKAERLQGLYRDYELALQELSKSKPDVFYIKTLNKRLEERLNNLEKIEDMN